MCLPIPIAVKLTYGTANLQVLNSYVDITLPGKQRRKELKETYLFDCNCDACSDPSPDPRESFLCRKCSALNPVIGRSSPTIDCWQFACSHRVVHAIIDDWDIKQPKSSRSTLACQQCGNTLVSDVSEYLDAINVSRQAYEKASKLQISGVFELSPHKIAQSDLLIYRIQIPQRR